MRRGRQKPSRREERTRDAGDREAQEIDRLREENERLRKQLEKQAKRIVDLERQLALKHQNSTLTSKSPSSDGLAGQQRTRGRRVKSRRRPGGQPGHHRPLVPLDRVDTVVELAAETCRHCARRLHARHTLGEPRVINGTSCVVANVFIAPTKRSSMGANKAGDGIGCPK